MQRNAYTSRSSSIIAVRCTLSAKLDTIAIMRSGTASMLLGILLILGLAKANAYETASDYSFFQPEGCEFSVAFPDLPKEESEQGENFARHIAFLKRGSSSLGAVCSIFSSEDSLDIPDETLSLWGWSYAARNGISLPEIEVKNTPIGKLVVIKGSRLVGNWAVIFKVHAYYGLKSRMTLTVTARTKFYPTPESEAFLESITRQK